MDSGRVASGPPQAVLTALATDGIKPQQFVAVLDVFGPLSASGQLDLVNRLISARASYRTRLLAELMEKPHELRDRIEAMSRDAERLLQHLHQGGANPPQLHSAITLALPTLYRIAEERGVQTIPNEPHYRLRIFLDMLRDLAALADRIKKIAPDHPPAGRGGKRRGGPSAKVELMQAIIRAYAAARADFPESGPSPAFGKPLVGFVRVGLEFAVSYPVSGSDGLRYEPRWAAVVDTNLPKPSVTTDAAVRGAFNRWLCTEQRKITG